LRNGKLVTEYATVAGGKPRPVVALSRQPYFLRHVRSRYRRVGREEPRSSHGRRVFVGVPDARAEGPLSAVGLRGWTRYAALARRESRGHHGVPRRREEVGGLRARGVAGQHGVLREVRTDPPLYVAPPQAPACRSPAVARPAGGGPQHRLGRDPRGRAARHELEVAWTDEERLYCGSARREELRRCLRPRLSPKGRTRVRRPFPLPLALRRTGRLDAALSLHLIFRAHRY